jgi:hypothetical protein
MGATFRTAAGKNPLLNPKLENSIMIFAVNMLVSRHAEATITKTGGHARVLLTDRLWPVVFRRPQVHPVVKKSVYSG